MNEQLENKSISAGGVVLNSRRQVLVVSQHGTSWSLPKGHLDPGEDELTAAKREVTEESGVTALTLVKKLGSYARYKIALDGKGEDTSELKEIHMFLFFTTQLDLKPIDPENPEARWVDPSEVVQLLTHQKDKQFFESVLGEIIDYTQEM